MSLFINNVYWLIMVPIIAVLLTELAIDLMQNTNLTDKMGTL